MRPVITMFGAINSRELMLRARSQGHEVSDEMVERYRRVPINECADMLEAEFGVRVTGENVFPSESFFLFSTGRPVKLRSTYVPGHFVTLAPEHESTINDLLESGFYTVWGN